MLSHSIVFHAFYCHSIPFQMEKLIAKEWNHSWNLFHITDLDGLCCEKQQNTTGKVEFTH